MFSAVRCISMIRRCNARTAADGRILYNPTYLMQKSDEYFHQKDIGQACEKAYKAVEMTLVEYVRSVEHLNNVKIVPSEESWNRFMLQKLVTTIAKNLLNPVDRKSFISNWNVAVRFHIDGWKLNNLTVEDVELQREDVNDFIAAVNSLSKGGHVAQLLNEKLFVIDTDMIVSRLKQITAEISNLNDKEREKKLITEFTDLVRLKTGLRNEQKRAVSNGITATEKETIEKRFGSVAAVMLFTA